MRITAVVVGVFILVSAPAKAQRQTGVAVDDPYRADDGSLSLTIRNNNEFTVKDISIECVFQAASGTELLRSTETVYQIFKPQDPPRRVPDLNFGRIPSQAVSAGCRATRAIPVP